MIQQATNGETILYDIQNDKYLKLNASKMSSGKLLTNITTNEYDGNWTSFAAGFSIYEAAIPSNSTTKSTTKLTTTTTRLTTTTTRQTTTTTRPNTG